MPDSWMEEYISEDYVSVDPLVTRLAEKLGTETLEAGSLGRSDAASQKAWSHNHGLKAAGFGGLHCTRFGNPQAAGKYVTLGYDHSLDQASRHTPVSMQLFSALLAATVGRGDAPADQTYPAAPSALTQRQREVLSCLAEGMMTARIAETLGISEAAVSLHFSNARKALGANTREHALALAMKHGLISL
jgi:DNA-binding CsgD family transcriptional regulator